MTIAMISARRRRRQPDELREEAIAAALGILVADGPGAITLQSVAAALGMTHGSITHHFGTAANLQAAVADGLIEQLLTKVRAGTWALKAGQISEADLVDLVFDSFETTGVGKLIGWLSAVQSPYSNRCSNGSPVYRTTLRLTAGMGPPSPKPSFRSLSRASSRRP
ncbi:TetR family transcriptional regulator [Sphingomonas sp. WKB10]|nr:TetR family transcriptional regulator [Sphingomonas sp. WKB10]